MLINEQLNRESDVIRSPSSSNVIFNIASFTIHRHVSISFRLRQVFNIQYYSNVQLPLPALRRSIDDLTILTIICLLLLTCPLNLIASDIIIINIEIFICIRSRCMWHVFALLFLVSLRTIIFTFANDYNYHIHFSGTATDRWANLHKIVACKKLQPRNTRQVLSTKRYINTHTRTSYVNKIQTKYELCLFICVYV